MAETIMQKAERLADLIVDRTKQNGTCSDEDLFRAGFTTDDLREFGRIASRLAAPRLVKHFAQEQR